MLEHIIRIGKPSDVVISALGVREGLLYELLDEESQREDPLLTAGARARLAALPRAAPWRRPRRLDRRVCSAASSIDETAEERRCGTPPAYLSDIGWRAHPDYRGEQALNIIAHAAFTGVDHPGRAYMALAIFYRHMGLLDDEASPRIRELASTRILDRARTLGGAMRVAYLVSAALPGMLPRAPLALKKDVLTLKLPAELGDLASDRLRNRLNKLGKLLGRPTEIVGI